ncbi:MAG TPA: D-hexose-6-phosphate mutarotase [Longimicrobium sp.]|nr:D-hexose-6-phosphate mutarotase [Longimicrobium sp.]
MTDPHPNVEPGEGGLPRVVLTSPQGGRAEVYLHGAHVTRWTLPERPEFTARAPGDVLYLSPRSRFGPGQAIRGGIPVIFPQFADQGPLPKHGFARTAQWTLAESSPAHAVLVLRDSADTRKIWDFAFLAELRVELTDVLAMTLTVENTGDRAFEFTCALHSYFHVSRVQSVWIDGLTGVRYRDKVGGGEKTEDEREVRFHGETDRVYLGAPDELRIVDGAAWASVLVRKHGFTDAVVWNPGLEKARGMDDLGEEAYPHFVCLEAACAGQPVRLEPGARWVGGQTIAAE